MKIYVDENIPLKIVTRIRAEGYIVEYVMRSIPDRDILAHILQENALLITLDNDFERLVLDEGRPTAGLIILRMPNRIPVEDRAQLLVNVLRRYNDKLLGTCCFLSETALDMRRLSR